MRSFRDEPIADDPLGLTVEQREISNLTIGMGVLDGPFAGLADALLACPSCRAYECLPGCLSRLAAEMPAWRAEV